MSWNELCLPMMDTEGPRRVLIAALLLAAGCGASRETPPPRSVVLVTIDTLRADRVGCYGHEGAVTPRLDELAENGAQFESAYSVAPLTLPSHVSLMTGTIPPHHGVRENGTFHAVPELLTLAEILSDEGLRTAAFSAAFVLDSQFGLDQGFEVYGDVPLRQISGAGLIVERPASEVNAEAVAWLRALPEDEPFFLWVHYFEPHLPRPTEEALPEEFEGRPYDTEVASADRALGRLLDVLDELERKEETLIVVTSDHGESLGEHGELTHSFFVYQAVLHVPLILSHPSLPAGETFSAPVSLVDVLPTVLDLLEVEAPELPPPARSLAPLLAGEDLADAPAYFESLNPYLNYGWAPLQGLVAEDYKLIRAPRPELYDLSADPEESDNLHASEDDVARSLGLALDGLLRSNEESSPAGDASFDLSAADRARLADLGYTGTASPEAPEPTLLDPKDGIARVRKEERLHVLFQEGRIDEVVAVVEELLEEDPENPVFNAHYGFLMLAQNRFPEAVEHLRRSVQGGYVVPDNLSNLGTGLFMMQRLNEAEEMFERALSIDAKHLPALFWLAQTHLRKGASKAARQRLETLLELWEGGDDPMVQQAREQLRTLGR